jgi:hypothetical protein
MIESDMFDLVIKIAVTGGRAMRAGEPPAAGTRA